MNEINVHTISNELRNHTIADLQLHFFHRGKVFLDLTLALALALASGSGSISGSVSGSGSGSGSG